jgi:hypothetical protein
MAIGPAPFADRIGMPPPVAVGDRAIAIAATGGIGRRAAIAIADARMTACAASPGLVSVCTAVAIGKARGLRRFAFGCLAAGYQRACTDGQ